MIIIWIINNINNVIYVRKIDVKNVYKTMKNVSNVRDMNVVIILNMKINYVTVVKKY